MKYHLFILFILFFISTHALSQMGNVYFTSSSKKTEVLQSKGKIHNAKKLKVIRSDSVFYYYPEDIYAYVFDNGIQYISKEITIDSIKEKVFLEVVESGYISLLYYKDEDHEKYFLQSMDSVLFELNSKQMNGHEMLDFNRETKRFLNSCDKLIVLDKKVKWNRSNLESFTKQSNTCELKPMPKLRYGFILGYGLFKLKGNSTREEMSMPDYKRNAYFNIGFFINHPFYTSNFSINMDLIYTKQSCSDRFETSDQYIDYEIDIQTLNVPIMLRHSLPKTHWRPYVNAGLDFAYNFKKQHSFIFATEMHNGYMSLTNPEMPLIHKFQVGYVLGLGLEYAFNYSNSIFIDVRYSNLLSTELDTYSISAWQFNVGCIF